VNLIGKVAFRAGGVVCRDSEIIGLAFIQAGDGILVDLPHINGRPRVIPVGRSNINPISGYVGFRIRIPTESHLHGTIYRD
jgi:hypothetical protein